MADYGLAAQIGRGNAMPGAQQQDPQNRMMQMMQLQQLQQNMMLAREQNAREAALAPLREGQLRASTQGDVARTDVALESRDMARLQREEFQRQQRINRGLISVMGMVDEGKLDLSTPAGFNQIPEVDVRMAARDRMAQTSKLLSEAEKAGMETNGVKRAIAYDMLDRAGDGITGPREYGIYLNKILKVEPNAADLLPRDYNPRNAQQLRDFVGDRKRVTELVGGVPTVGLAGSPIRREVGVERFLPAGVAPPTQAQVGALAPSLGGVLATPQMGMDPARMAAGTPADVGAMQSGMPGQRLPVAGGANFQSLGSAGGPLPASQVIAEQATAKSAAVKMEALPKVQTNYVSAVESLDRQIRAVEDLLTRKGSLDYAVGPIAGRSLSPTGLFGDVQAAQSEIDSIKAGAGLAALKELRESSPNGSSGLGGASNEEGKRLENSIAALNQLQNPIDFRRQLATLKGDMERAKGRLAEAYKREYGSNAPGVTPPSRVQRIDNVTVTVGNVPYYFPNKAAADEFAKRAGQ
jgi:hypothetical protein